MMGGQVKNRKNRMKNGTENGAENRAEGAKAKKGAHKWMNIRLYFIVLILAVGILVMGILLGIFDMLDQVFYVRYGIVTLLWLILLSVLISGLVTTFLTNRILQPIRRLRRAMGEVARGDFQVRLETGSRVGEVQEIYEHFNQMAGELAATEMLQRDFVSNVSHEFKTPINAIEGYAMLLQGDAQVSGEQAEYIDKILFNTRRLSGLVGNILLLSRMDNQTILPQRTLFRLDEQIRQAVLLLEPKWTEKDVELDAELEPAEYLGNESLLLHVWTNLIDNAVKFGPRGGVVRLRLYRSADGLIFYVEDQGPGVDEDKKKRIFDRFYQADSSHQDEGNGLGLALAKQILDKNGGGIQVKNMPGGGCRFTVWLPESESEVGNGQNANHHGHGL